MNKDVIDKVSSVGWRAAARASAQPLGVAEIAVASPKNFKLRVDELRPLAQGHGSCIASDQVTVDGMPVGWMYREEPDNDLDSGWRFFSGCETPEYADDANNFAIYDVNTIANYDSDIVPLLGSEIGSAWARDDAGRFQPTEPSGESDV